MIENTSFKFVKGTFSAEDAKEVMFKLIQSKISYHQLEAFSISERTSANVDHIQKRIFELNETKNDLETIIALAKKENKKLKIDGTITIEFID
ncbi:hypothetical protein [Flavobacterium sp.]|uniref:hypothetical protein n=1 Tax=Flavobacterium sp. TaxID=239 RepID=UPI0040472252